MSSGLAAICFACELRQGGGTCDAYPDGIPDEILFGGFDHRKPFGGERKKDGKPRLFKLNPEKRERLVAYEEVMRRSRAIRDS